MAKYVCPVCGYVHEGDAPPEKCPQCGVPGSKFIEKKEGGAAFTDDDGATWTTLPEGAIVSMNMWGFTASFLKEIENGFEAFLEAGLQSNPLKCEYFLPTVVSNLLAADKATVSVLTSEDKWYGVTYKEDKPVVENAIKSFKENGLYPESLWGDR